MTRALVCWAARARPLLSYRLGIPLPYTGNRMWRNPDPLQEREKNWVLALRMAKAYIRRRNPDHHDPGIPEAKHRRRMA